MLKIDKIYSGEEIEKTKASPSFEREYNLKYLGPIGNVFSPGDIDAAITEYDIIRYDSWQSPLLQLIDASAPSFIRALKLEWGERTDYE